MIVSNFVGKTVTKLLTIMVAGIYFRLITVVLRPAPERVKMGSDWRFPVRNGLVSCALDSSSLFVWASGRRSDRSPTRVALGHQVESAYRTLYQPPGRFTARFRPVWGPGSW